MPSVNFTFFPIPANVHRRTASTSTYTVPAGRFASVHACVSEGRGVSVNGTQSISSAVGSANTVNCLWLNEGDTLVHSDSNAATGTTVSEFDK